MKVLTTTVARILFAIPFAVFGLFHFINGSAMAGFIPSWLPGGVFWVYLTGIVLILASVSLIIQKQVKWAALGLAAFLALTILTIWLPSLANEAMRQTAMTGILKDLALLGASLTFFSFSGESRA